MLSHFMGGHNRAQRQVLWLAERRAEQLAERLARSRRQAQDTLAERDRRIADLEAELARTRTELAVGSRERSRSGGRSRMPARRVDTGRLERRMLAARRSLRRGEQENERLRRQLDLLTEDFPAAPPCPMLPCRFDAFAGGDGPERCLLYVGGHCSRRCRICVATRRPAASSCCITTAARRTTCTSLEGLVGRADGRVLPDRLRQPSGLPRGQAAMPAPGQALRAVAHEQRHLLSAGDRPVARNGRRRWSPPERTALS